MLNVKTPDEAKLIIYEKFRCRNESEEVSLFSATGRILFEDIISDEYVPGFDRSAMDGYAVRSSDTFGCSESIPAILELQGTILMGDAADEVLKKNCCFAVPTGGALPKGSDAVVMIEKTEDYGDGTIGILSPAAPGLNYVFKGDDLKPGDIILHSGRKLSAADIGSLASLGKTMVKVYRKTTVGILATGDELVDVDCDPKAGQVRNINSSVLASIALDSGSEVKDYGIIRDSEDLIRDTIRKASEECDIVLLSGGSSAGEKDNTAKIIEELGCVYAHGIAIKPGKPTIIGEINGKPVFGMPGHPGANFFIASSFVKPLLYRMNGMNTQTIASYSKNAVLTEAINSNHGRAQIVGVKLRHKDDQLFASPIITKAGLITSLAELDGYIMISRDCEGIAAGETVEVHNVI